MKSLVGANGTTKVVFGTEAGLFDRDAGILTVVRGFMGRGHKPDEFVDIEQLNRCDQMLDKLLDRLREGMVF